MTWGLWGYDNTVAFRTGMANFSDYADAPRDEQGRILLHRGVGVDFPHMTFRRGPDPTGEDPNHDFHYAPPADWDEAMGNIRSESASEGENYGNWWGSHGEARSYAGDQHGAMTVSAWWHPHDLEGTGSGRDGLWAKDGAQGEVAQTHVYHKSRGWVPLPGSEGRPVTAARTAMPTWYHLTDDPDFKLDPSKHPNRPYGLGQWHEPGVFLTQRPDEWSYSEDDNSWSGDRPYIADIDAPDNLHEIDNVWHDPYGQRPGEMIGSEEIFVPADQFHHLNVQQVRPRKAKHMTAAITVYTKPDCPQCTMTKKQLDKLGIEHQVVDVTADPDAHAYVTGLGYQSAPVVVVGDGEQHWSGFSPDKLKGLVGGE